MNENLPNELPAASHEFDELDRLLLEEPGYIDDDGFTARVVETLPVRSRTWLVRRIILGVATFIALLLGCMSLPQGQDIATWTRVALNSAFASPALAICLIGALGVALLSASVAWVMQEK